MEIKKILWPTDLSRASASALPYVTSLGKLYQAEIVLAFVADDLSDSVPWYGEFEAKHLSEFHDWIVETAGTRMDRICEEELHGCPYFRRMVLSGDAAPELLKLIHEEEIDLVVMTTHGMKGHFPFGSVAEKVVRNSPAPVLTVRPKDAGA